MRGCDQPVEILPASKFWMEGIVAAFKSADRIRTSGIVRPGCERVVRSFSVGSPDRMDRRKVERVESHVADARQIADDVEKGAVPLVVTGDRSREEFVPARIARSEPLGVYSLGRRGQQVRPVVRFVHEREQCVIEEQRRALFSVPGIVQACAPVLQRFAALAPAAFRGSLHQRAALGIIHRLSDARDKLLAEVAPEAAEPVNPALDGEFMHAHAIQCEFGCPSIVRCRLHSAGIPALAITGTPPQFRGKLFVTIREYRRADIDGIADDALDREIPAFNTRCYRLYDDARSLGGLAHTKIAPGYIPDRLRAAGFDQAHLTRSKVGQVGLGQVEGDTGALNEVSRSWRGLRNVGYIDERKQHPVRHARIGFV